MPHPHDEPSELEAKRRIAAWIRDYLTRSGTKQVELANDLGVSEPTISNIVSGRVMPGFKMLIRLHFRIGAPIHEVLRHKVRQEITGQKSGR